MPTILDVFTKVSNFDTLCKMIVKESELYAHQKGIEFSTNVPELKAYFGMVLAMSIHKLPETRLYWSTLPIFSVPFISSVMPRQRFELIRSCLHFADNSKQKQPSDPDYDRAFKIRPVIDHFNKAFEKAMSQSKIQSIDEHMVKFRGRNIMRQYMKDKPISWGFKCWCRCDAQTGYLHQIDIYTGKKEVREVGLGESVVLNMCKGLEKQGIEFYFDNFFNSPLLQLRLKEMDVKACGTVRKNRVEMPTFVKNDKDMKRGDVESYESKGVVVLKWMDNKAVYLASNFLDPNETGTVKRRQTGNKERLSINRPKMIGAYNNGMNGVDTMDQNKSYYEYDRKSKMKFYLRLYHDLLDLAVKNAEIVYNKLAKSRSVPFSVRPLDFRAELATQMIGSYTNRKRLATPMPYETTKRQKLSETVSSSDHYLTKMPDKDRKRCIVCTKEGKDRRTNSICVGCQKPFCYQADRDCFQRYHKTK